MVPGPKRFREQVQLRLRNSGVGGILEIMSWEGRLKELSGFNLKEEDFMRQNDCAQCRGRLSGIGQNWMYYLGINAKVRVRIKKIDVSWMQDSHLHKRKHESKVFKQVRFLLAGMSQERRTPSVSLKNVSCRFRLDPQCKCHSSTGVHAFPKSHRPSACSLRDKSPWRASCWFRANSELHCRGRLGSIPGQNEIPHATTRRH